MVTAVGTRDSLVEVAQQLAWLSAALQSSPLESGVAICLPAISTDSQGSASVPGQTLEPMGAQFKISSTFQLKMKQPVIAKTSRAREWGVKLGNLLKGTGRRNNGSPGQSWHDMFVRPVIVSNYPILPKGSIGSGLEASLLILSSVMGLENGIDFINGVAFMKTFSSMLVTVRRDGDFFVWHFSLWG